MERKITIDAEKFKEILLHNWHILPQDKQQELISIGIYPHHSHSQMTLDD